MLRATIASAWCASIVGQAFVYPQPGNETCEVVCAGNVVNGLTLQCYGGIVVGDVDPNTVYSAPLYGCDRADFASVSRRCCGF